MHPVPRDVRAGAPQRFDMLTPSSSPMARDPAVPPAPGGVLVSVVVPCFNGERFLARTIESVLSQTYRELEIIVVDDRSTDGSVALVRRYAERDERVRLIERDRNAGAPAAPRNTGVRAARGNWIAFLDADDVWHPEKLDIQMKILAQTGADLCSTRIRDFVEDSCIRWQPVRAISLQRITWRMQLVKYRTPTSSIVVRRDLMLRLPFNEDPSYKAREDTDCFIRVHEHIGASVKVLHPLVFYRIQRAQISGNKWKMVRRHLDMLRKYRCRNGTSLGPMAYVYTATHFTMSVYLRSIRRTL